MSKKVVGKYTIREVKSAKDFKKPQRFDAFIDSIAKTFGIKKKRNISLILINNNNEEIPVSSQEDFDDFWDDLKEFKFYLEEGEQSEPPIKKKESKKEDLKSKGKDESEEQNKPEKLVNKMKNEKKKCSFNEHKEIDAIKFCQNCKLYICNKCEFIHSGWFKNHIIYDINNDLDDIFTGICKEKNHSDELDYFCKTDNKLCCAKCITKLKGIGKGQHSDCDICFIQDIKNDKIVKLRENIKYLESISNSLEQTINDLKKISENINENKEKIKTKVQKLFTNLRNGI